MMAARAMHAHQAHKTAVYDYHVQASVQALPSKECSSWCLTILWHDGTQPASHTPLMWTLLLQALLWGRFVAQSSDMAL